MINQLTVIIPFLNEGIEINNTVHSIRSTAGYEVDILLVNDDSKDGFDYEAVAEKYNATYITNENRKGVAWSRDYAVTLIKTPYFILIDGHMRFYHNNWWKEVVSCLKNDDRALYCCQSRALNRNGEIAHDRIPNGAFIAMEGTTFENILNSLWITVDHKPNESITEVPCVLGASYAASKRYWTYIRGLSGLRYYGSDEVYLSLKVWLEGGKCILLKNIEIGHIFRNAAPYRVFWADSIYNKLFIADTVLPNESHEIHTRLKRIFPSDYSLAKSAIVKNADEINEYRTYYKRIFTRDYSFFQDINKTERYHVVLRDRLEKKLKEIAYALINNSSGSTGLMEGEIGNIVFLYDYADYIKNRKVFDIAEKKLTGFLKRVKEDTSHNNLYGGVAGIGLALNYLTKKDLIDFDDKQCFEEINRHLESFVDGEIRKGELGFFKKALGIEYYLLQNGNYNLSRLDAVLKAIKLQIQRSEVSLSMSNGLLGSISFLLHIWQTGFKHKEIKHTIDCCVNYIREKKVEKSLCYNSGDLIVAYILLRIALVFFDEELKNEALNMLIKTCQRKDSIHENILDASIFHGSSGPVLLYYLSYIYTNNKEIENSIDYWLRDILDKSYNDEGLAGFVSYKMNTSDYNSSFIYGISGIGLTLISLLSGQIPEWRNWLLL